MPIESVRSLWRVLEVVRSAFTPASFALFVTLVQGWVLTSGRHAITDCLLAAGVAGRRDHTAFYRFCSRGTWSADEVGRLILNAVLFRLYRSEQHCKDHGLAFRKKTELAREMLDACSSG